MTPAVSILVPVYNVSNFIERCAHSLFRQTFEDIEYVFVNDCTPDDSIEKLQKVIEQYPQRKERIKIIHHEKNRGLAAARNTAIDNSIGRYIAVVDSDDYVELDMIELMYRKAEEENADIVVCDAIIERKNRTEFFPSLLSEKRDDIFRDLLAEKICIALWNKVVRRKLYELPAHRVPEGLNYFEDHHVSLRFVFYANKIIKVPKVLYHYVGTNNNAMTKNITIASFENFISLWKLLDIFLKENNIYNKFKEEIEFSKVSGKMLFFLHKPSYFFYKKYAFLFHDLEMKYFNRFRLGEKLILFFTHYRMYVLALLTFWLIWLKNNCPIIKT